MVVIKPVLTIMAVMAGIYIAGFIAFRIKGSREEKKNETEKNETKK